MSLSDKVVVMRLGQIEQVGTPRQIFNQPKSLYVAEFMGYVNRLPVTVLGKEGEHWSVQTDDEVRLHVTAAGDTISWQQGQRALLRFRPDETVADPLPATNNLQGRVQLVEYMGKAFEAVVQLKGASEAGSVQLLVQSQHPPAIGEKITFGIRPERLLLFAGEESAAPAIAGAQPQTTETALQEAR